MLRQRRYQCLVAALGFLTLWCALPRRTESYFTVDRIPLLKPPVNRRPTDLPCPNDLESFVNRIGMRMIRVPAGKYRKGSPNDVQEVNFDEAPHDIQMNDSFWISQTEVTQAEWRSLVAHNPSQFIGEHLPVTNVTFWEAREFCRRVALVEGKRYRLPTETEWEYACRAGTTTPYATGQSLTSDQARYRSDTVQEAKAISGPREVGSFRPNAWGLYDMHGNVAEWTLNRYVPDNHPESPFGKQPYFLFTYDFPLRGGGWDSSGADCRSARRDHANPVVVDDTVGFRVVMEAGK